MLYQAGSRRNSSPTLNERIFLLEEKKLYLFFFVVKHTMTKAFKIGIGNLLFEFLAHTLVFLCTLNSARAVTACPLQALFNCLYCFFVGIKCYFHLLTPQFLRCLPLISSLDYTIYRNLKIVKHASASLSIRVDSLKQSILLLPRFALC